MLVIKLQKAVEDSQKKNLSNLFATNTAFFPGSWSKRVILDSY